VQHEKALKGHFPKGTTVPIIAFFMDPSPIEDPTFIGEVRIFMKTNICVCGVSFRNWCVIIFTGRCYPV
jgi:hypothetical protein